MRHFVLFCIEYCAQNRYIHIWSIIDVVVITDVINSWSSTVKYSVITNIVAKSVIMLDAISGVIRCARYEDLLLTQHTHGCQVI
jgi:hypothetical protein